MRLPPLPTLTWRDDGAPFSEDIGDVYFSGDGLSEKRAVFLSGCGLPDAWAGRDSFVIAELGLGAGLNLLATWDLWRQRRPGPTARLHFVSLEGALMGAADAKRIHRLWPELADLSAELVAKWPARARGLQRIALSGGVTLDIMIDDVAAALPALSLRADAWFLDGFSPAKNPDMWSPETMQRIAALSAPGARLASYAVAGDVRRNLEAAGFTVEKKPGHGRKKERLEARLIESPHGGPPPNLPLAGGGDDRSNPPPPARGSDTSTAASTLAASGGGQPPRNAIVIGAGVAGCCVARALLDRGCSVTILDSGPAPGSAASGNPLALVMPRLDATDSPAARALIAAFLHSQRTWLSLPSAAACKLDVQRLPGSDTERTRFQRLLADPPLDASLLAPLDPENPSAGLIHRDSIAIRPAAALPLLLDGAAQRFNARAIAIEDNTVTLSSEHLSADLIVVCAGMGSASIAGLAPPPLEGRLGQLECSPSLGEPSARADGGYVVEAFGDLVFGATFEPAPDGPPPVTDAARAVNFATLARLRPDLDPRDLLFASRASVRATTPDRMPFAGPAMLAPQTPDNEKAPVLTPAPSRVCRLVGGLGARGYLWSPLLAELVVAEAYGEPAPVENSVAAVLDPDRFRRRALRKGALKGSIRRED